MKLNADWEHCSMDDFVTLNREDYELFESILSEYMCSQHVDINDPKLNTLKSKLIFIIHNTH